MPWGYSDGSCEQGAEEQELAGLEIQMESVG